MQYAVVGGDIRFAYLVRMLQKSGRPAKGFFQDRAGESTPVEALHGYDRVISNWPMRFPLSKTEADQAHILNYMHPGSAFLLCGPQFPAERRQDLEYVNLWADEALLAENAYLTAEGAVAALMARTRCSLRGMDVLIVGYGRIGRALTQLLVSIGAQVTVATGSCAKRGKIEAAGAKSVRMESLPHAVKGKGAILSTPPETVIGMDALKNIDPDALLVDLASSPYGFDPDLAHGLGLNAWREPGLPGRYCPVSAARAIFDAILRWEENRHA